MNFVYCSDFIILDKLSFAALEIHIKAKHCLDVFYGIILFYHSLKM